MALRLRFALPEHSWLSLTPEPERELPAAVATLRAGAEPDADAVRDERERVQELVVRGTQRRWLAYLREAVELATRPLAPDEPEPVERARAVALEVLGNHHALLLGLPGRAAEQTEAERARLAVATIDHPARNGDR